MSERNKQKTPEEHKKLYEKFSRDQLIAIIAGYEEMIEKMQQEKPEQEKIKNKCGLYREIESKLKEWKLHVNKSIICSCINLSRRTQNHRELNLSDFRPRKVRSDSLIDSPLFASIIQKIFEESYSTYGHRRVNKYIKDTYHKEYSDRTINNAMNKYLLIAAERFSKKQPSESKTPSAQKTYLLFKDLLKNYKPNEVFSIYFSQIKTINGVMWMHGARDVITGKMWFLIMFFIIQMYS